MSKEDIVFPANATTTSQGTLMPIERTKIENVDIHTEVHVNVETVKV